MNTQKNCFWTSAMISGLMLAVALIAFSLILWLTGNVLNTTLGYFSYLIMLGIIMWTTLKYRKGEEGQYLAYSKALGYGTATVFLASILVAIWTYLLYAVIDPGLVEEMAVMTETKLLEGGYSEDMVEQQMAMSKRFMNPALIALMVIVMYTFFGFILSLIAGIFTSKKQPNAFEDAMSEIEE